MHTLPDLPYEYDALEPYIDEETMRLHHGKHHAGYVEKLNKALESHKGLQDKSIEDLLSNVQEVPEEIRQTVINNGGGHANHSFFWKIMSPKGGGQPEGELAASIKAQFGDFNNFKEKFTEKALGVFGSGWAFLVKDTKNNLILKRHSFQNSPLMHGNLPILGVDVWEHAYYLKYQNRRADYLEAWWKVINWKEVAKNFNNS